VPAAELLSWSVDEQAAPLAVEHLAAAGLQPAQRSTLLAALARLAPAITPPTARRLYALVNGAGLAADRDGLAALCAILDRTCGARKDVFNDMVGDAGAYDKLRGIVEPLLTDANPDNVAWAAEFGGPFAPRMSALSAQFFHDTAFHSRELHCRYTPQLENRRLPIKRNENICAMFSGRLNIAADGEYRFFCSADDAARLWINGRKLVDTLPTVAGEKAEGSVKLAPGQHWIQIAWKQLVGDLRLRTTWQGPGFSEQELPADRLTTTLTPRDHAALLTLIDRLNDRSRERRTQAAEEIKRYKEAGSLYLANAVRHAGGRGLGEAFRLLEEMKTPGVGDLLMERLKASADAKLNATAAAIFAANAKRLQPADAAQLHSLLVNDTAFTRIDLLGVMEALYQGPCQQKPDAFNKLVGVNNGIELIRAYLQRAAASGASSAAKTARQWLAKAPWKPPA
jgi:hypothetical protein